MQSGDIDAKIAEIKEKYRKMVLLTRKAAEEADRLFAEYNRMMAEKNQES